MAGVEECINEPLTKCSNPDCRKDLAPTDNFCSNCGTAIQRQDGEQTSQQHSSEQAGSLSMIEEDVDSDDDDQDSMVVGPINLSDYFEMPENRSGVVDRVKFVTEQMRKLQQAIKKQLLRFTNFHKRGKKAFKLLNNMLSSIKTGNSKSLQDYFGEFKYDSFIATLKTVVSFAESLVNLQIFLDWVEEVVMVIVMSYRLGNDLKTFLTAKDKDGAMCALQEKFQTIANHVRNNGDLYQRTFLALAKLCTQDIVYCACSMLMSVYDNRENGLLLWIFENPMRAVGFIALLLAFLTAMWCAYLRYTRPEADDDDD